MNFMPLLIDGHNLIGRLPDLSLADADDEQALVARLRRYRARTHQAIVVVFDRAAPSGSAPILTGGGVEVLFARAGHTADALILERLRRERQPSSWTVVTADRELAVQARALRAQTLSPEEFSRRLASPPAPRAARRRKATAPDEKPSAPGDVEEWLKLFGAPDSPHKKKGENRKT
ncbi:MAG: NYN domain-containing protein [Anaerolineae bacterium]|nr:NYN domain-containing protein [Anaerolineae bacterium]